MFLQVLGLVICLEIARPRTKLNTGPTPRPGQRLSVSAPRSSRFRRSGLALPQIVLCKSWRRNCQQAYLILA